MTKANECTCPSGDGSLRHPCPAHIGPFDKLVGSPVHNESEPDLPPLDEHLAQVFETGMALSESVEQAGGDERDLQGAQGERDGWGPLPIVQVPWNVFDRAVMWVEDRRRYGDDGTIVDDWKALKTIQRAALAQPSPKSGYYSDQEWINAGCPPEQPSPAQAEQAEAERPELWAVHAQGPDELYAAFTREDAEKHAAELNAMPVPEGIAVGAVVVPSPWPEAEHWKYLAEQERDHKSEIAVRLRQFERICEGLPQDSIDGGWTVQGIRCYAKRLEDQLKSALARVAELERCKVYVEARQCDECQHGGINDSATGVAACHECDWSGPEPEEDKCPGCQRENCMAAACPQCGARYVLVASEEIAAPVAQAQQLNDLDKQCRDDVARALGLRPNQERGFAWSYLLASIKSCVKASGDSAQAQHSGPGKYDEVLLPFLKSMEHELHANAGKGDRPGWLQMDRKTALLEIYYHLGKLQKATKGNDTAGIVEYAADVANMSMMLVDVCGLLAAAPGKQGV
ncbi:TPA: hypothetical protein ACKQGQ_006081 [Pseudomonas aeruginosa]|uniref:hypothetical protein n=1 Tax=Pseudomonas aeruginosa TaxID=287 RepID=UPI00374A3536